MQLDEFEDGCTDEQKPTAFQTYLELLDWSCLFCHVALLWVERGVFNNLCALSFLRLFHLSTADASSHLAVVFRFFSAAIESLAQDRKPWLLANTATTLQRAPVQFPRCQPKPGMLLVLKALTYV